MQLDVRLRSLIAVGASIGADCGDCLRASIGLARQSGAGDAEIREAIAVGRTVRRCAARRAGLAGAEDAPEPGDYGGSLACCAPRHADSTEGR